MVINLTGKIVEIIINAAKEFGIEPEILLAVARAESNFKPDVTSPAGAMGLFQFVPSTFTWVLESIKGPYKKAENADPYNPETSARCGAWYLKYLIRKYCNRQKEPDYILSLMAYNWGEGNLQKYLRAEPDMVVLKSELILNLPSETFKYIRKVIGFYREYKNLTPK